jgi:hypothetical protein
VKMRRGERRLKGKIGTLAKSPALAKSDIQG